jgi:hypothetical protein
MQLEVIIAPKILESNYGEMARGRGGITALDGGERRNRIIANKKYCSCVCRREKCVFLNR